MLCAMLGATPSCAVFVLGDVMLLGGGSLTFSVLTQGYLVTLVDRREVVARVARRFMPRLKTESEVATMNYLREHTSIPVPEVYHYDANPYNRLGGEYILMSKVSTCHCIRASSY